MPGCGRLGIGRTRPSGGKSGTSSSSGSWTLEPSGTAPGGRGGALEKIPPICARAGDASVIAGTITNVARAIRIAVRLIWRSFNRRIGLSDNFSPPVSYFRNRLASLSFSSSKQILNHQ
jgi:hypothetical protein